MPRPLGQTCRPEGADVARGLRHPGTGGLAFDDDPGACDGRATCCHSCTGPRLTGARPGDDLVRGLGRAGDGAPPAAERRRQLATLGEARVVAAPWAHVRPLPGGRLLLLASAHPADPDDPADMATLRRLVDALDLRAAQEAHRS
ncbi:hypothetical protein AB6N24_16795 [Cellulomonas sp. 179-A 4D5 NHS]|uniref:hypothetical protein n=1 Tax=Cellulomonas sp. 179-A 4D5 NHS TaxID=3142378 RepID=UPI0039A0DF3A